MNIMNKKYKASRPDAVFFGWAFFNIPFMTLLAAGFLTGFIQPYIHDVTYLSHIIIAITVMGSFHMGYVAWKISQDFRNISQLKCFYHDNNDAIYHRLDQRLDTTRYIAHTVLGLGFLGTVLGVVIGLQNFPADAFTNVTAMQGFIQRMLSGFSTELHTLVAGLFGNLWLMFNIHIMERYDSKLLDEIL